ncbi:alpha mannosidase, middle domain protein, partial [Teladorsagia circumcincta]
WLLRAADLLSAQKATDERVVNATAMLDIARKALLLFQHHDAITGTSRKRVMEDYSKQLHKATLLTNSVIESSLSAVSNANEEM